MSTTVTPSSASSSQSTDPALIMTITGIDGATVVAAERMRDYARQLGFQAGLVLNVQTPQWRLRDDHAALEFVHESAGHGHELLLGGLGPLGGDAGKGSSTASVATSPCCGSPPHGANSPRSALSRACLRHRAGWRPKPP
ncbi:hypothetical protein [Corynebacterium falsenii]